MSQVAWSVLSDGCVQCKYDSRCRMEGWLTLSLGTMVRGSRSDESIRSLDGRQPDKSAMRLLTKLLYYFNSFYYYCTTKQGAVGNGRFHPRAASWRSRPNNYPTGAVTWWTGRNICVVFASAYSLIIWKRDVFHKFGNNIFIRGVPNLGHRKHVQKFGEIWTCDFSYASW